MRFKIATLVFAFGFVLSLVVSVNTYLHPLNQSPYDKLWALAYACSGLVILLLCSLRRGRLLLAFTAIGTLGIIIISILFAKSGMALVILAWTIAIASFIGTCVIDRNILKDPLEKWIFAPSIGLGIISFFIFGLAIFHLLYPQVIYIA